MDLRLLAISWLKTLPSTVEGFRVLSKFKLVMKKRTKLGSVWIDETEWNDGEMEWSGIE
jgi:hypothetical protein